MDNTFMYVTDVCTYPKEFKYESGKQAHLFSDREFAEEIASQMNANGYGVFVMEVPDYFLPENLRNK